MRTYNEMMSLIMDKAKADERIRAVYMQGSRVIPYATHDKYCDYDIVYLVEDIKSFTNDQHWIDYFGDILVMEKPADWYGKPYDYNGNELYNYLMQFKDGNRIDLTLIDMKNLKEFYEDEEPRIVLLNKDSLVELRDREVKDYYNVKKPTEKEFFDTENEFWWLSICVAKGLCREELTYVKFMMERYEIDMLYKMLNWKIGIENDFLVSTGKCYKYFKQYLSEEDMKIFAECFPNGYFEDIWGKLFNMCKFFNETAAYVSGELNFEYSRGKGKEIIIYLEKMRNNS